MIRQALDPAIRTGDIRAESVNGAIRAKGSSLRASDVLTRSAQTPIIFLPRSAG
jgi:hypothetical protein